MGNRCCCANEGQGPGVIEKVDPVEADSVLAEKSDMVEPEASVKTAPKNEFAVTLTKGESDMLGADVTRNGNKLTILRIKADGLLTAYNEKNPDAKVQTGDQIIMINGAAGDPNRLLQKLSRDSTLEMTILRP